MPPPKSLRACERCRQHKSRCLSGSSPDTCAGCEHSGARCIPHLPVKRGTKAQQTIEELSRQVAALRLALQEQSKLLHPDLHNESPCEQSPSTLGGLLSPELESAKVSMLTIHDIWTLTQDSLVLMLQQYNAMAIAVPFALVLDTEDASSTLTSYPVLVLAALNMSPNLEPRIAKQLDITFHRVLADQAMVQGKQNFDILGGLITYLLWFHHRYDPETQQFFQYLQLAKAMVEDLQVGKCLESGADMISDIPLSSVARMLAGLYFVDQGTNKLDNIRQRQPMTIDDVRNAFCIISASKSRPADVDAEQILKLLCGDASMPLLRQISSGHGESSLCYSTIRYFSSAWVSLQSIESLPSLENQAKDFVNCAEQMKKLVDHICQQPPGYLQSMTLVEWAYLLTILVKVPHLEGCVQEHLLGYTEQIIAAMRSHLLSGHLFNPGLFRQSKHLWWLEGVLNDAESIVSAPQDPLEAEKLLKTSTYELLEQLTERLTGFRKGIKIVNNVKRDNLKSPQAGDNFDRILAEWVHIDQA